MEIIKILKDPPVVVGEREEDTGREGTEVVAKKTVDDSNSQEQPNSNCFLLFYYIPGCSLRILVGGCGVSVTLGPRFLEPGGVGRQCEHKGMNNIVSHSQGLNTQSYILGFCCNFAGRTWISVALTSCFVESEWRSIQNINVKTRGEKTD